MRLDVSSDRMVIENRNTPESKAASVWAMMSRKWNDPQFSPTTMKIGLHSDFHDPIAIDHDVVSDMTPATPLQAGTAPPPAIETVAAAATDPLPATFPGTPRAGAAPPPAIEMASASTDQLLATFPNMPRVRGGPLLAIEETAVTLTD